MLFKYNDLDHQVQTIELPISINKFIEVKGEVEGKSLEDINYYWLFWEIRDALFKQFLFDIHKDELLAFIERLQLSQFDFKNPNLNHHVKVVDVYYNVYYWNSVFVAGEPSIGIYDGIVNDRLELHLDFDTEALEHLLEQLLDAFGVVDYDEYQEEEELATSEIGADGIFEDLVRECWLNKKATTQSEMIGMLFQATGCGSMSDLDSGDIVEETEEGIKAYLKSRGVDI